MQLNFILELEVMNSRPEHVKKNTNTSDADLGTPLARRTCNDEVSRRTACDQSFRNHDNKLPINLFYSAAEYNKMLITNGRSLRKKEDPQIDGYLSNLQFINDPIFQSCEQRRESLREKSKHLEQSIDKKKASSLTKDCVCCCCEDYCKLCSREHSNKVHRHHLAEKLVSEQELYQALQKIKTQPLKTKKKNKKKIVASETNFHKRSERPEKVQNGCEISDKQASSSYLSHKSFNIDKLIHKSLAQFQQQKHDMKVKKIEEMQKKVQRDYYIAQIQEKNRELLQRSKSEKRNVKAKSAPKKANIRLAYWESIKNIVCHQLEKDRRSSGKNKIDKLSKSAVNQRQPKYSNEQIQKMRLQHEQEAKEKIFNQLKEGQDKKRKIERQLEKLDQFQRSYIQNCEKRKFEPNEQMIRQAFQNIVEPEEKNQKPLAKKTKA